MLTQSPINLDAPIAVKLYQTRITLVNRRTGDEQCFDVVTLSDRFSDVMRSIQAVKAERGLRGYEVFEFLTEPGF